MKEFIEAVANKLEGKIKRDFTDTPAPWAVIEIPTEDGKKVKFHIRKDGKRMKVSSSWPRDNEGDIPHRPYDCQHHKITTAISRGPEALARAIKSRFLPDYVEEYREMEAKVKKNNEYHEMEQQSIKRIAGALGEEARSGKIFIGNNPHEIYGKVRVHGNKTTMELGSVPLDIAEKIIELIKRDS